MDDQSDSVTDLIVNRAVCGTCDTEVAVDSYTETRICPHPQPSPLSLSVSYTHLTLPTILRV